MNDAKKVIDALELIDSFRGGFVPDPQQYPYTVALYESWKAAGGCTKREEYQRFQHIRHCVISAALAMAKTEGVAS